MDVTSFSPQVFDRFLPFHRVEYGDQLPCKESTGEEAEHMIEPSVRLRRAILLNDLLLVRRIVRNHPKLLINPDFDDKSNTSLHLAALHGCTEIAAYLIEAGHDRNEISRNTDHDTPLMLAAREGHVDLAMLIAGHFPRCIPFVNKTGMDALSFAAKNPASTALIPTLLSDRDYASSPHSRDQDGNTALHHASASGSLKALRILLSAGADPQAKNNHDWRPLAYSQTVAAEVYFKNLMAEFERRKQETAHLSEERERAKAAGLRIVDDDDVAPRSNNVDEDELIDNALKRHWSPIERKRPITPGGGTRHEWGAALTHMRTRSGSGD